MKKLSTVFLLFILLFPTIVLGKDTCNPNDIVIKNISVNDAQGFAEETQSSIDNNKIITDLKMYKIGDSIEYNILIENSSDEDYYFNDKSIKMNTDYLEYNLTNNEELIPAKTSKTLQLNVTYKNEISNDSYEDTNKITIVLSDKPLENPKTLAISSIIMVILMFIIVMTYTKINSKKSIVLLLSFIGIIPLSTYAMCSVKLEIDSKVVITNKEATFLPGEQVNIKMKQLAGNDTSASGRTTVDTNITAIKHSESEPIDSNKEEKNIVSILESDYPIYMWYEDGIIYWWSEDIHPSLNQDASYNFLRLTSLNDISGLSILDTSDVTTMVSMFGVCSNLTNTDALEKWNTSNVTTMQTMFANCSNLASLTGLKKWDVSNVTTIRSMFQVNVSITSLDGLENWNVSKVESLYGTFMGQENIQMNIESLEPLKNWNVSNVTDMTGTLQFNTNLTSLNGLENWDVSKLENMKSTFYSCNQLTDISSLRNWDVSNVTIYSYTFNELRNLIDASPINDWNIKSTAIFTKMFVGVPTHPEFTKVQGTWNSEGTFIPI